MGKMMKSLRWLMLCALALMSGCAVFDAQKTVSLPVFSAWYEGQLVNYITTDVSDPQFARMMKANYAPRLQDAIPSYPKPPEVKTVLERVYAFPNQEQSNNVFASIPSPLGYQSQDENYSPLWLMYMVTWRELDQVIELRSEADIFRAEAKGWVDIERTNVVVNCPVVSNDGTHFLPVEQNTEQKAW